jgi:hypothetical protein
MVQFPQKVVSTHHNTIRRGTYDPSDLAKILLWPVHWIGGALAGLLLVVEAKHRRGELIIHALPEGLESAWFAPRTRTHVAPGNVATRWYARSSVRSGFVN